MKLLAIDRSTEILSAALSVEGTVHAEEFAGIDARNADWPTRISEFIKGHGLEFTDLDRIVVGMGPGSFAGIRGALSFAQGLAIGIKAKRAGFADGSIVYGIPSPAALAQENGLTAVVGDARRGLFWVVVYDGVKTVSDFRLVEKDGLYEAVPENAPVVTSDSARIGEQLEEIFGDRYRGGGKPSAGRMAEIAMSNPELLVCEPLPVYLSPAVRQN
ncbi:MAG: tRNA (adenosine(37)-N6)-threonylcarbamoyltransferase complex dimerization subunit type 1 TsaB [Kiritimatiellae bacterium]|nr:tRNA (adenosine(37)-N6)-threonylcarbamoyltransferase complex dimerization subunit type 1 TsaB [Kiritimatiellia bacterium]